MCETHEVTCTSGYAMQLYDKCWEVLELSLHKVCMSLVVGCSEQCVTGVPTS